MEKLLRKTGITISLRCLLIVASLVFGSSAWGQINLTQTIELTTFSSFSGSGYKTVSDYTVKDSKGNAYSGFSVTSCMLSNSSLQMAKNVGKITSPTITSAAGFDITVTYKSDANFTVSFGSDATNTATAASPLSASTTSTSTTFTIKTNAKFGTISKITLTPKTTSGGGGETTLTDRNLSFGDTKSFDAEVGGTFSAPSLSGVTDDGVTYASSDATVASVDANGAVTIVGMGHAKITASAEANATYKAGSDSYDIYVYDSGTIEKLKTYITSSTAKDIYFNLTSTAVVTYAATNYAYMEDSSAGIYIFKNGHGLTAGNSFTGKIKVTGTLWNQLYELTSFTPADAAGTADIPVTDWTIKELLESENTGYKMAESMRVKLTGVTVTEGSSSSWTIVQDGSSATLYLGSSDLTVTTGSTYDITGYPTNYNDTWEIKVVDAADLVQIAGKTEPTVTFDQESYTVETNGNITVCATTNSTSEIVYSISPADDNVAIDAETGYIVAGATAGTYTITATVAENESYTSAYAECVLTITAPAYNITAPTYYKKITSTDELAVGGTYLIVCEGEKKGLTQSVSTINYTQGENNTVTNETAATLGEFELVNTNETYNEAPLYELLVNNKYLSGSTSTTISLAASESKTTKWMIGFDADGNVEIDSYSTFSVSETNRGLVYQTSGKVIKHYAVSNRNTSGYLKVQLYQKVTDLAISTLTNGYATFVTDVPYVMPKGACGYAVTVAPHVGVITKTEAYTEGQPVPAQTALLIGGAPGTNYYPAVLKEDVTATYSGENYMEGKRTEEGYTDTQKGVAVFYYKLALNSASKPGFYYGAADGAAFQLTKPTTAYLAVPKSIAPVNGFLIDFEGETTGIDSIGQTDGNADSAIYNLNGIRMTQTLRNLPKGVYIVNGKKIIK